MNVTLALAEPTQQTELKLTLQVDATLTDALAAAVEQADMWQVDVKQAIAAAAAFGVWGKVRPPNHPLREGDRVEIYRALRADPKDARRRKASDNKAG